MHALHRPESMDVKAYASGVGRARGTVRDEVYAAEVARSVSDIRHELSSHFAKLVEIHAAPAWLWPALVAAMLPSTRPMGEVLVDRGLDQARWRLPGFSESR
jgi:hypothetical protein